MFANFLGKIGVQKGMDDRLINFDKALSVNRDLRLINQTLNIPKFFFEPLLIFPDFILIDGNIFVKFRVLRLPCIRLKSK